MPRLAHIGDCHFKSDRLEESIKCFRHAVSVAIEKRCETIVIPGDIWDKSVKAEDDSGFNRVLDEVAEAAERIPILMCYGNHDRPGSLDVFRRVGVRVYSSPTSEEVGGVFYSVLPYPTKQFLVSRITGNQDDTDAAVVQSLRTIFVGFAASRAAKAGELPHVLLFHGNVLGSVTESGQVMYGGDVMVSPSDLDLANCDYGALNHIHKAQNFGKYYYAGSLYHQDFGELEEKSFNIVDVEVGKFLVVKVLLPTTPMVVVKMMLGDNGEWLIDNADHETIIGMAADIKVKYKIRADQMKLVDEASIVAMYPKAMRVKCEREVVQQERIRCVGITEHRNLRDKVRAWGETVGEEIGESVLLKADEVERECR